MNQACKSRLARLVAIVQQPEAARAPLSNIKRMRAWVLQAEHVLDGSWAKVPEERSTQGVRCRFAQWLRQLETSISGGVCDPVEQQCLGHLLQVMQTLRPWLLHGSDIEGLPRTNNEMELLIRALKTRYRRISGRKNWNSYLVRSGRCVSYYECWVHQPGGVQQLEVQMQRVSDKDWRAIRQQTQTCQQYQLNR